MVTYQGNSFIFMAFFQICFLLAFNVDMVSVRHQSSKTSAMKFYIYTHLVNVVSTCVLSDSVPDNTIVG